MKWGLIARAEDRGLGIMTWEIARALRPDKVLVVSMGDRGGGFKTYPQRYTDLGLDVDVISWSDMGNPGREVMRFLRGLDVVYSAETFYDWKFCTIAAREGVATVCHTMPEFFGHWRDAAIPSPTRWWAPTSWRMDRLPEGTPLVPVPVALDRWPEPERGDDAKPLRVLHVAGNRAVMDRNGTLAFAQALRKVTEPVRVTVMTQGPNLPASNAPRNVDYRRVLHGLPDYWRMYDDQEVLVMPRRFGGLCLPVQEAAGAGLAIGMTAMEPNWDYPCATFTTRPSEGSFACAGDDALVVAQPDPREIAALIDTWARDRDAVWIWRTKAREWADRHSWDALAHVWRVRLAEATA